ncbi:MAG TPA: PepSY-associated TM helix domain-containing protein, partial [Steroidobacteraceae bacterium]|nr:PepSY-associated TM helix domain-containing protein [Steroidobacteraceae bacterium]
PGRDAWVSIDRANGAARFEATDRGWIAYFNDLHKGRNTGIAWTIFIDVVAAACVFFALTGLVLLWIQARQRTSTWPLVGGGVAILVVLMMFLAH